MLRLSIIVVALVTATGFITSSNNAKTSMLHASDRRAFLDVSIAAGAMTFLAGGPFSALAEDAPSDLSMPDEEEQKKIDMEERLRKKAELKKKLAKPNTYQESFKSEMDKQKSLQKTKEERRLALCEELGRGC